MSKQKNFSENLKALVYVTRTKNFGTIIYSTASHRYLNFQLLKRYNFVMWIAIEVHSFSGNHFFMILLVHFNGICKFFAQNSCTFENLCKKQITELKSSLLAFYNNTTSTTFFLDMLKSQPLFTLEKILRFASLREPWERELSSKRNGTRIEIDWILPSFTWLSRRHNQSTHCSYWLMVYFFRCSCCNGPSMM